MNIKCRNLDGSRSERGIIYSDAEERAVKRINEIGGDVFERNRAIGAIVAEQVEANGGTSYGKKILERLSEHPEMQCSIEHLRRCWRIHQLMSLHGDRLHQTIPSGKYGHYYALSRLLEIEDAVEQEKAVFAMAELAENDHLTAAALERKVSGHLDSIARAISPKPAEPKADTDDTPDPAYNALFEGTKAVFESVEQIIKVGSMRQVARVTKAANTLGFTYCTLVGRLIREGEEETLELVRKMINSLTAIISENPQGDN